jgi:hypothetical protein
MAFFLFILVNATLFLRPGEIVPELLGLPIYECLIVACLIGALPEVMHYLSSARDSQPITFCVLGILGAVVFSQLASLKIEAAGRAGVIFVKVFIYYFLLVSVINTPRRLRIFVFWLACFIVIVAVVTVLHYHDIIQLRTLQVLADTDTDPVFGQQITVRRLMGSGIFHDPNEFCLVLAAAMPLALYQLSNRRLGPIRWLWLAPLGLFLYGVSLTHSRGGFLAMLAGLGTLALARLGLRRALVAAALALPVVFALYAGRQTDLSTSSGTGQSRIQIWSEWLADFRTAPVFGIGMAAAREEKTFAAPEDYKYVAHNSYLHTFTELGFLGGMFFLGAACLALYGMWRINRSQSAGDGSDSDPSLARRAPTNWIIDPEQRRLAPYLMAMVACYFVGMLSLSLAYVTSTYVFIGLGAAYMRVTAVYPPLPPLRFDFPLARRLALVSIAFLACMYVFIRVFVRWA